MKTKRIQALINLIGVLIVALCLLTSCGKPLQIEALCWSEVQHDWIECINDERIDGMPLKDAFICIDCD